MDVGGAFFGAGVFFGAGSGAGVTSVVGLVTVTGSGAVCVGVVGLGGVSPAARGASTMNAKTTMSPSTICE